MANNFDNPFSANVVGLWDFRDGYENDDSGLGDGIAQDGTPANGPSFAGGWMLGNGDGSRMDVDDGDDAAFDLSEGTIVTAFRPYELPTGDPQTVMSRGLAGAEDQDPDTDFMEVRVTSDGSVEVYHVDGANSALLTTDPSFFSSGDIVKVSYAWSTDGVVMSVENTTQGTSTVVGSDVNNLTLDLTGDDEQSFAIGSRETVEGEFDQNFNGAIDYLAVLDDDVVTPESGLDGIVEGSEGDDLIDVAYTGDPEGDMIDNDDAINPADEPNDDLVNAGAGDDTVEAGVGDDTIHGGSGSDVLNGGEGDDVIEADTDAPGVQPTSRQVFEWDRAPDPDDGGEVDDEDDLSGGFSQDTGSVTVDFSVLNEDPGVETEFTDTTQFVGNVDGDGNPVEDSSGLSSLTNGDGNGAGYQLDFSAPVENVSFRINDIDGDGVVQVTAFDANGDPVVVNLAGGPAVTLSDTDSVAGNDTATANGGYASADNADISLLVTIPGPISRLVIDHEQVGHGNSGTLISDVYFDATNETSEIVPGDDTIDGGDGDDIIIAGGGNDDVTGGEGSDSVDGGDGDDIIDTSGGGAIPLPDRGFPGYVSSSVTIPPIPADGDTTDDMDTVDGGAGNDTITTGDDADYITGGTGDDSIDGGIDDDTISGGADNDYIVGGEGADSIQGDAGNDTIYGGLDPAFPDVLNILDDGSSGDPVDPDQTNGMDVIDGGEGNDLIYGQDDDDTLSGGAGDDTLFGGIDEDELSGGAGDDVLLGGQGADLVMGGDDADIIGVGIGDTIVGGEGGDDNDAAIATGLATVNYDGGDPSSESGTITYYNDDLTEAGTAEFSEIENVYVVGTASTNAVLEDPSSGPGALSIDGVVEGTSGDDLIDLAYTGDPEGDMVDNDDAVAPLVDEQDVIVAGAGNDTVEGHFGTDVIFGGADDDDLYGMQGNDAIDGGTGDDWLDGGAGRDILAGGDGNDTISGSSDDAEDGGDLMFGQDGDDSFVNIGQGEVIYGGEDDDGLDVDVLDLTGAAEAVNPGGTLTVTYDVGDPESGVVTFFNSDGDETGTTEFHEIETVVLPCFTPGTLIATPKGERKVEDLKAGDRVITRDNGIQEIRWLGRRDLSSDELSGGAHLQPVLIRQGALGNGLPERDMMVSPNHRVLVANNKTALYFEDREVLVAAKHLTGLTGVDAVETSEVSYIHFMFDQHEVVLSDGAWTESFQPGDMTLRGLDKSQRDELLELFPELKTQKGKAAYPAARRSLKKHEARLLVH
ncbi:Hint domain-containing protein [Parasedimentitalea maritima]|nr:Hint domain-containing protein [Zongyanglinia marina]